MPRALTVIALLTALVLLAASSTINYLFASSLGRTALEGNVLGVVAVGVDILKAVLAVAIGVAARDKHWGFVAIGSVAFILFSALSLSAAVGFSATNRSAVFGERERQNNKLAKIETNAAALRDRLKSLPASRPLPIVDEALAVARSDWRWTATKQCVAVSSSHRNFCDDFGKLRTERAAALEANRLSELLTELESEADKIRGTGGGSPIDPQARALAQSMGFDEGQVQRGLMALLAIVIEVASGFGAYLALGGRPSSTPDDRRTVIAAEPETMEKPMEPTQEPPPHVMPTETPPTDTPRPGLVVSVRAAPRVSRRGNGKTA